MKVFLCISILLNFALVFEYFQNPTNQGITLSSTERINQVRSEYSQVQVSNSSKKENHKEQKKIEGQIHPNSDQIDFDPIIANDDYSFTQAHIQAEEAKREFHIDLGIPLEVLEQANDLKTKYWRDWGDIAGDKLNWEIPFDQRVKLIHLEEKLDNELRKLYGRDKWKRYKAFIDTYNHKIRKLREEEGHEPGGLVLSYY